VAALERVDDGRATWLFDREQRDNANAPWIDALRIDSGSLDYRDALHAARLKVGVQDASRCDDAGALRFTIDGIFRNQTVALQGSISSLVVATQSFGKLYLISDNTQWAIIESYVPC
jgi:hypothetical protein